MLPEITLIKTVASWAAPRDQRLIEQFDRQPTSVSDGGRWGRIPGFGRDSSYVYALLGG